MSDDLSNPNRPQPVRSSRGLTPERVKLLAACIIAGRSRKETAQELGVGPRTVTRWKKDPRLGAELERRRNATHATRAFEVLNDLQLHCKDDKLRLQAAQAILRTAMGR